MKHFLFISLLCSSISFGNSENTCRSDSDCEIVKVSACCGSNYEAVSRMQKKPKVRWEGPEQAACSDSSLSSCEKYDHIIGAKCINKKCDFDIAKKFEDCEKTISPQLKMHCNQYFTPRASAIREVQNGNCKEALSFFEGEINKSPQPDGIDYSYAWSIKCYIQNENYKQALAHYEIIRKKFSGTLSGLNGKGMGGIRNWDKFLDNIKASLKSSSKKGEKDLALSMEKVDGQTQ